MEIMEYNVTSRDREHKYTINIPLDDWHKLKLIANESGIKRVSIYLRTVISNHIKGQTRLSLDEIVFARQEDQRIASADYRRERFDLAIKKENKSFKKKVQKLVALFSNKQYTLF